MMSPLDLILSDAVITHLLSFRFLRPHCLKLRQRRNPDIGNIVAGILTKTSLVLLGLFGATEGKKGVSQEKDLQTDAC